MVTYTLSFLFSQMHQYVCSSTKQESFAECGELKWLDLGLAVGSAMAEAGPHFCPF